MSHEGPRRGEAFDEERILQEQFEEVTKPELNPEEMIAPEGLTPRFERGAREEIFQGGMAEHLAQEQKTMLEDAIARFNKAKVADDKPEMEKIFDEIKTLRNIEQYLKNKS